MPFSYREIIFEKLGIINSQKDAAKIIIQKIIYAINEYHYFDLYRRLEEEFPTSILDFILIKIGITWEKIEALCKFFKTNFLK